MSSQICPTNLAGNDKRAARTVHNHCNSFTLASAVADKVEHLCPQRLLLAGFEVITVGRS